MINVKKIIFDTDEKIINFFLRSEYSKFRISFWCSILDQNLKFNRDKYSKYLSLNGINYILNVSNKCLLRVRISGMEIQILDYNY